MTRSKFTFAVMVWAFVATTVLAQGFGNNGGQNGNAGGEGFGIGMNSGFGSSLGGIGTGSGSGLGGMMGGLGSSGSGGMGGSGFGGSMGGLGTSGEGGSGPGQSGARQGVGQGRPGFVGRDSADMAAIFELLRGDGDETKGQSDGASGGGERGGRGGRGKGSGTKEGQEENAKLLIRVRLDVAFQVPRPQSKVVATVVRDRLGSILARRNIPAPGVEFAGDTVILRGVAQDEDQRLLIEKLVSLEPGVGTIDNQMTTERP
jgi:hypothetical protein